MTTTHKYQKLGGWLLVFTIFYFLQLGGVFLQFGEGGLMDVLRGWSMYDGARGWLLLAGQVASLLLIFIYFFAGIEILRRNPYFLRTRQLAFAVTALDIALKLADGLLYGFAAYEQASVVIQAAFLACSLVFAMLYYTRSVRVRTYMGSDEYLRLGFFTKGVKGPEAAADE
ncbi:MAG: hypothetical protein FWE98_06375 [Oscillospiraceae bacterium]|nr:hypothetical protein [Oscillospiraceae bacterium]